MLSQILMEFENTSRGLCFEEIAQRLGRDPKVVAGALALLVNMGKLDEIETASCEFCPVRGMCSVSSDTKQIFTLSSKRT